MNAAAVIEMSANQFIEVHFDEDLWLIKASYVFIFFCDARHIIALSIACLGSVFGSFSCLSATPVGSLKKTL